MNYCMLLIIFRALTWIHSWLHDDMWAYKSLISQPIPYCLMTSTVFTHVLHDKHWSNDCASASEANLKNKYIMWIHWELQWTLPNNAQNHVNISGVYCTLWISNIQSRNMLLKFTYYMETRVKYPMGYRVFWQSAYHCVYKLRSMPCNSVPTLILKQPGRPVIGHSSYMICIWLYHVRFISDPLN